MLRSVFRTTQFKKDFKGLLEKHYDRSSYDAPSKR